MKKQNVVHVSLTRAAIQEPSELLQKVPQHPEKRKFDNNNEELYRVHQILDHRRMGKGYQFLTHLTGKAEQDAEWQPTKDFVNTDGTINAAHLEYLKEDELFP